MEGINYVIDYEVTTCRTSNVLVRQRQKRIIMDTYNVIVRVSLLIIYGCTTVVAVKPNYMWPLNHIFYGYETQTSTDSLNPINDHTIDYSMNANTNLTTSSALVFDGTHYIDVPIGNSIPFPTLTFSVYLKPTSEGSRCVVAHYKATTIKSNTISEFVLEGRGNKFVLSLVFDDGTIRYVDCPNDFKTNRLGLYTMMQSINDGKICMYFDLNHKHYISVTKTLSVPGTLRFAGHQDIADIGYIGEMSCAIMLSQKIILDLAPVITMCNSITKAQLAPSLIWPLDEIALGYQILTGIPSTYQTLNPPRFRPGPADLVNKAVRFDGSFISTITTTLSSGILQQDFSIIMYLVLDKHRTGTLINIQSVSAVSDGITGLSINVLKNGIFLSVFDVSLLSPCGTTNAIHPITSKKWFILSIQRHAAKLYVSVNGTEFMSPDSCQSSSTTPSTNMKMVIGARSSDDEGFKGGIRCLSMYTFLHASGSMHNALVSYCNSSVLPNFTNPDSLTNLTMRTTHQHQLQKHRKPPLGVSPLITFINITLTNCGKLCLETAYCRSYTYNTARKCSLYDILILQDLIDSIGTHYYNVIKMN